MESKEIEVSKEVEKPKEEKKGRYEEVEIVTEKGLAVVDHKTEKIFSQQELLVELLNKLDNIEVAIFQK